MYIHSERGRHLRSNFGSKVPCPLWFSFTSTPVSALRSSAGPARWTYGLSLRLLGGWRLGLQQSTIGSQIHASFFSKGTASVDGLVHGPSRKSGGRLKTRRTLRRCGTSRNRCVHWNRLERPASSVLTKGSAGASVYIHVLLETVKRLPLLLLWSHT